MDLFLKEKKAEPHLSMDCFLPLCLFVCLFYEPGTMLGVYSYDSAQRSAQRFTCGVHTSEPVGGRLRPSNHPAKLFDRCWKNKGEKKTTRLQIAGRRCHGVRHISFRCEAS